MRFVVLSIVGLCATSAFATVPGDSILIGTQELGSNTAQTFFNDGTPAAQSTEPAVSGGDFAAMALGDDNRIWSLHLGSNTLVATDESGFSESFSLSSTASDFRGMTATASGRVFLLRHQGDVYEVDTSDGSRSLTSFNHAVTDGVNAEHIAAAGERLYVYRDDVAEFNGSIDVYNAATGAFVQNFDVESPRDEWAMVAHPSGDIFSAYSPDDIAILRQGPGGAVWFRGGFPAAIASMALSTDNVLWVLLFNGEVYRVNADTGVLLDGGSPIIVDFNLVDSYAGSLLTINYSGLPSPPTDVCPDNPQKFADAGICGCDFYDVPGPVTRTPDLFDEGTGCVHVTATWSNDLVIGDGAYVYEYAQVGTNVHLGDNNTIAARATLGNDIFTGEDVVVGRRSIVGSETDIGSDSVLSRSVTIGAESNLAEFTSVGYGSTLPWRTSIESGPVNIGALVTFLPSVDAPAPGDPGYDRYESLYIDGNVTIARGATFNGWAYFTGTVTIGPDSTFGDYFEAEDGVRVRKGVTAGVELYLEEGVRIGRDVTFGDTVEVGLNSNLGANVTVSGSQCIPQDTNVPRGATVDQYGC